MAERVYLHVGAPKTGTTYLQQVMLTNRDRLLDQGVLYATGGYPNDRIWAMEIARGNDLSRHPKPFAAGAWDRVSRQIREHPGIAVLSHEFLGACDEARVRWVVDQLSPSELHVVFTARDYVRQAAAAWQERVKSVRPVELDRLRLDLDNGTPNWSWRTLDMEAVLARWATAVPADRIHVVTVPQPGRLGSPLWSRFASVVGIDPDPEAYDTTGVFANQSLGLVEVELLRRVDERLPDRFRDLRIGNRWVRNVLAQRILARRPGEPISVTAGLAEELVERSRAAAAAMAGAGYHVVGDLDELVPDGPAPATRRPGDVSDSELLDAALDGLAGLLVWLEEHRPQQQRPREGVPRESGPRAPQRQGDAAGAGLLRRAGRYVRTARSRRSAR